MSGPWEDFPSTSTEEDGPWADFGGNTPKVDQQKFDPLAGARKQAMDYSSGMAGGLGSLLEAGAGTLAGIPSGIAGGVAGWYSMLPGVNKSPLEAQKINEQIQEFNFGFGAYKPTSAQAAQAQEKIIDIMEAPKNALGWVGEKALGSEGRLGGEILGDVLANFVPLGAFTKTGKNAMAKFKERAAARKNADGGTTASVADKIRQESYAQTPDPAFEAFDKGVGEQGNLFPDDGTGHATPYDAGVMGTSEPINPMRDRRQQDLPLRNDLPESIAIDEAGVSLRPEDIPAVDAAKNAELARMDDEAKATMDAEALTAQQTDLFPPQTNMHRAYTDMQLDDGKGGSRPMNFTEFKKTIDNLANEPGTRFARPEDIKAAFEDYKRTVQEPTLFNSGIPLTEKQLAAIRAGRKTGVNSGVGINNETLVRGFSQEKDLSNGYRLVAKGTGDGLNIEVYKGNTRVGGTMFDKSNKYDPPENNTLRAPGVKVDAPHQGKGLATAMYKYAHELGNDLVPSGVLRPGGKALWGKIAGDGITELNSGMNPKESMDALVRMLKKDKIDVPIEKSLDGSLIPKDPATQEVLKKALAEGKDGKLWTYFQSGGTNAALKSGSAAIQAAAEIIQNMSKRTELFIRRDIFPAEHHMKKLSSTEIVDLAKIVKDEMFQNKRYDPDILSKHLSIKQMQAYVALRDMFDTSLAQQNAARVAQGKSVIGAKEAYLSSRWSGDFRRPIYDKEGKLVWYLAADTTRGLEKQTADLLKEFPDLVVDKTKDHRTVSSRTKTDLESMYTKMLDILGRNDPAISKIQAAIEEQMVVEGEHNLGQKKHFQQKGNVRGFVGDRPGKYPKQEAIDMFQQQIQYAKNGAAWSSAQAAADAIKPLLSSPELRLQQPNNVKFIREYFKNSIGFGEAAVTRAVNDLVRDTGISPKTIDEQVGNLKSFFILQKLAVSAGFTIANVLQTANILPHLALLRADGFKGNPVSAVAVGYPAGMAMGVYHYMKHSDPSTKLPFPNQFFQEAFDYAEQNGVTARSIMDESPITASFSVTGKVANVLGKTLSIPETFVRSTAYMSYVQMLKSSGKFTDNIKLFQKAEEMVNNSMVDYRAQERALAFGKAGSLGNFMNTLQTYPMNFYNNYALMAGRAMEGSPLPLVTMLAVHYSVAGFMGIPGFNDMDKLWKFVRDNALPTGDWGPGNVMPGWAKVMKSPFLSDPKLWMMENMGKSSVYGPLSESTGLGLTSRVAAPGTGDMIQAPGGVAVDLAKQALAVGSYALDPTNKTKAIQAAMKILPTGISGGLETSDIAKDTTYTTKADGKRLYNQSSKLAERVGSYERTPMEDTMRKFGIRSQKEISTRDITYATETATQEAQKRGGELIVPFYDALRRGDAKKASELNKLYIDLTGNTDGISDKSIEDKMKKEGMSRIERMNEQAGNSTNSMKVITGVVRMNKLLKER